MLRIYGIELFEKGFTNAGALLIDRVFGRIRDVADAAFDVPFYDSVADLLIYVKQLIVIVVQLFEQNAFWMPQEKQIHSLRKRWHGDFHVVVIGQEDPKILVDDHAAQRGLFLNKFVQKVQLNASFP